MTIKKTELKKQIMLRVDEVLKEKNQKDSKFSHTYSADRWQKHGEDRLYFNRSNGRNKTSKGYIDLENIDFSNLDLPGGQMYNKIEDMKEQIQKLEVK